MAYRDAEMKAREFLDWIVALDHTQIWKITPGPVTTVVAGCAGYLMPGSWRPRHQAIPQVAKPAEGRC